MKSIFENGKELSFTYSKSDWLPKKKDHRGTVIIPGTSWTEKREAELKKRRVAMPTQDDTTRIPGYSSGIPYS